LDLPVLLLGRFAQSIRDELFNYAFIKHPSQYSVEGIQLTKYQVSEVFHFGAVIEEPSTMRSQMSGGPNRE
jgi:hypothetical protein